VVVDGTDLGAVYEAARRAIEHARAGGGPSLIESVTLRMEGHAVHDDAFYVPKELHAAWAAHDPLEKTRLVLGFSEQEEAALGREVEALIEDAVRRAEASPHPDPAGLLEGVYEPAS